MSSRNGSEFPTAWGAIHVFQRFSRSSPVIHPDVSWWLSFWTESVGTLALWFLVCQSKALIRDWRAKGEWGEDIDSSGPALPRSCTMPVPSGPKGAVALHVASPGILHHPFLVYFNTARTLVNIPLGKLSITSSASYRFPSVTLADTRAFCKWMITVVNNWPNPIKYPHCVVHFNVLFSTTCGCNRLCLVVFHLLLLYSCVLSFQR